jgi:bifunctional DNA-binding transcriptional regulator/antitoxin component of YhaV-PrlF toxin-antitoxin module
VDRGIEIPLNRTRPIAARTDAENGYLGRTDNRGRLLIPDEVREKFSVREHLHNGRLIIYLQPIDTNMKAEDKFTFKIGLQDDSMPAPVETTDLTVRLVEEADEPKSKPEKGKRSERHGAGQGNKNEGKGEKAPTHGLPKCVLLTKDGRGIDGYAVEQWPTDFTESDGGLVQDLGNGEVVYKINYDNAYHVKYRTQQRGQVAKDVVTEKYILGMRILMLGYEHALRARQEGSNTGFAEYADDFRRMAARGAASTVLALAENLPKIVDQSTMAQDVE